MNNFPSCLRRGPALHQAVQGEACIRWYRASPAPYGTGPGGGKPVNRRSPLGLLPGEPTPRLYDYVAEVMRTRHDLRRTEQAYIQWIRRLQLNHSF